MPGSHPVRWIILLCATLAAFGCANTDTDQGATGSLSLDLVLAGDIQIDVVDWQITGNGMDMGGSVDVSGPGSTASVEVYGLPVGDEPYTVELSAVSVDQEVTCRGSANFDVEVGVATPVMVILNCKLPQELGAVRVNGKFNICTQLTKAVVSPLRTSVGNDISLSAQAFDEEGDEIHYIWTGTGGSIADPSAASTTYTCQDVGNHTVMIMVTDNDVYCRMATWTIPVTCVEGDGGDLCEDVICEDDGNECTETACNPANGACETSNVADGTACDGGAGTCSGGQCVEVDLCEGVDCNDNNECTADACNPADGTCSSTNVDDGTPCNNDEGVCSGGSCVDVDLCEGVVCDDTGNECTVAMCNTTTGECDTMNVADGTACNGGQAGTCQGGVCVPNPECVVAADCPDTGNECIDRTCDTGTCGTSFNTNACDGGNGTCDGAGLCVPNPECVVPADCPETGNECIDPVCNAGVCETSNNTDACDGGAGTCNAGVCEPNEVCEYAQNFELFTLPPPGQTDFPPNSLSEDGWLVGGNEFESDGTFFNSYFSFPAPNGGPAFSAVVADEGDPAVQGSQQMSIYNDYNNANHGNGPPDLDRIIEAVVFRERTIVAADVGTTICFTFDAKAGNIEGASTAEAFIQVLNQVSGSFAVLVDDVQVTTNFSTETWANNNTICVPIDGSLDGQLLQYGGRSRASNFEGSGIFYDNMSVCSAPTP